MLIKESMKSENKRLFRRKAYIAIALIVHFQSIAFPLYLQLPPLELFQFLLLVPIQINDKYTRCGVCDCTSSSSCSIFCEILPGISTGLFPLLGVYSFSSSGSISGSCWASFSNSPLFCLNEWVKIRETKAFLVQSM